MKRIKRKKEEEGSSERWLVSYADFITLLFAFFVVLYATSEKDREKGKEFEESIKKHLTKAGIPGAGVDGIKPAKNAVVESRISPHFKGHKRAADIQYKIETYLESELSAEQLAKLVSDISDETAGIRISLKGEELFKGGSVTFRAEGKSALIKIGNLLNEFPYRIFIEGHVYENSFQSSRFNSDRQFSSERAVKVLNYIESNYSINPQRMAVLAYGSSRPAFSNSGKNQKRNSRIDILIATEDFPL